MCRRPEIAAEVTPPTYFCLYDMLLCMRTTILLDDHLYTEVKKHAVETGRTVTNVVEDALRETLARRKEQKRRRRVRLPVWQGQGQGLMPGVDLDDTAALLDLMDGIGDTTRR